MMVMTTVMVMIMMLQMYRFYNLTMITLLLYTGVVLFLIIAYSKGWTTKDAYPVSIIELKATTHSCIASVSPVLIGLVCVCLCCELQYSGVICEHLLLQTLTQKGLAAFKMKGSEHSKSSNMNAVYYLDGTKQCEFPAYNIYIVVLPF